MTYNPSIPQPADNLSTSQGQMLINFGQLNTQFGVDHTGFNTGSGNGTGFHKKVTWLDQTASIPTSSAGQIVAYGKTVSSITMPYYKRDGLATEFALSPIKALSIFTGAGTNVNPSQNTSASFNISSVTCSSNTITVTLAQAMRTSPYGVIAIPSNNLAYPVLTQISSTQFTISTNNSGTANSTNWTVIVLEA